MTVTSVRVKDTFTDLDDVVLFDVVRESGNELIGLLLDLRNRAEARGDFAEAGRWETESREVTAEMSAVWGREALLVCLGRWQARTSELRS